MLAGTLGQALVVGHQRVQLAGLGEAYCRGEVDSVESR